MLLRILEQAVTTAFRGREVIVNELAVVALDGVLHLGEDILQLLQILRDGRAVRHADVRPHVGVRRCNARRVFEAAAHELYARLEVTARAVQQRHERRGREMRYVADDRGAAVVARDVQRHELRLREPQQCHELFVRVRRCARVLHDDVGLAAKQVGCCGLDAALLPSRHGVPRDIVDIGRQDRPQVFPDILLRAARIREDSAPFQIRQDFLHHRHNLQHGRAEKHDIRITHDLLQIRPRVVHGAKAHGIVHGALRATEARDVDAIAEPPFQAETE